EGGIILIVHQEGDDGVDGELGVAEIAAIGSVVDPAPRQQARPSPVPLNGSANIRVAVAWTHSPPRGVDGLTHDQRVGSAIGNVGEFAAQVDAEHPVPVNVATPAVTVEGPATGDAKVIAPSRKLGPAPVTRAYIDWLHIVAKRVKRGGLRRPAFSQIV